MKAYQRIVSDFRTFLDEEGNCAFIGLKYFFEAQRHSYFQKKISELVSNGVSDQVAFVKARQGGLVS